MWSVALRNRRAKALCRRLSICLAAMLVLNSLLLPGCGGGGAGRAPAEPLNTVPVSGSVDLEEIGGTGLVVHSVFADAPAPVDPDAQFSTTVSSDGAQLLLMTDAQDAIRGMAMSVPGVGAPAGGLAFDAENTAATLVFLTRGILSTDPSESATRLTQIRQLASFPALAGFLRDRLLRDPLAELADSTQLDDLLCSCVEEWIDTHAEPRLSAILGGGYKAGVIVEVTDSSNPAQTRVRLSNWGWRYVEVQRRDLRADGSTRAVTSVFDDHSIEGSLFGVVGGAVPISWGSLFAREEGARVGDPSVVENTVNLSETGAGRAEYWLLGPGWADTETSLPSDVVHARSGEAWGLTLCAYAVVPIIDAALAGLLGQSEGMKVAAQLWNAVRAGVDLSGLAAPGASWWSRSRVIGEVSLRIFSLAISTGALERVVKNALISKLGEQAAAAKAAALAKWAALTLLIGAIIFGGASVDRLVDTIADCPPVARISLYVHEGENGPDPPVGPPAPRSLRMVVSDFISPLVSPRRAVWFGWEPPTGNDLLLLGYELQRSINGGAWSYFGDRETSRNIGRDATYYWDQLTEWDSSYAYRLRAVYTDGSRSVWVTFADVITTPPAPTPSPHHPAPAPVSAEVTMDWHPDLRIYISWTPPTEAPAQLRGYQVERSINQGDWSELSSYSWSGDDHVHDEDVAPGSSYRYRIRAVYTDGYCSSWVTSDEVEVPSNWGQ